MSSLIQQRHERSEDVMVLSHVHHVSLGVYTSISWVELFHVFIITFIFRRRCPQACNKSDTFPYSIYHISRLSKASDPHSCILIPFLSLGSLFHFCFPSSLIILLFSYAWIITRLSISLHLSFPLLHFMLDTPDPLIEQETSSYHKK